MGTTLTPNLMSEDINASVALYRDHLGFDFLAGVAYEGNTQIEVFHTDMALPWAMLGREVT